MFKILLAGALLNLVSTAHPNYFSGSPDSAQAKSFDAEHGMPAVYNFQYDISDDGHQVYIGHQERRNGDDAQGQYSWVAPDGARYTVTYTANADTGYVARVNKEEGAVQFREGNAGFKYVEQSATASKPAFFETKQQETSSQFKPADPKPTTFFVPKPAFTTVEPAFTQPKSDAVFSAYQTSNFNNAQIKGFNNAEAHAYNVAHLGAYNAAQASKLNNAEANTFNAAQATFNNAEANTFNAAHATFNNAQANTFNAAQATFSNAEDKANIAAQATNFNNAEANAYNVAENFNNAEASAFQDTKAHFSTFQVSSDNLIDLRQKQPEFVGFTGPKTYIIEFRQRQPSFSTFQPNFVQPIVYEFRPEYFSKFRSETSGTTSKQFPETPVPASPITPATFAAYKGLPGDAGGSGDAGPTSHIPEPVASPAFVAAPTVKAPVLLPATSGVFDANVGVFKTEVTEKKKPYPYQDRQFINRNAAYTKSGVLTDFNAAGVYNNGKPTTRVETDYYTAQY